MKERLTVAFVVGKAVEAEFEFDRQRLVGHLKRQLERLQVQSLSSNRQRLNAWSSGGACMCGG